MANHDLTERESLCPGFRDHWKAQQNSRQDKDRLGDYTIQRRKFITHYITVRFFHAFLGRRAAGTKGDDANGFMDGGIVC